MKKITSVFLMASFLISFMFVVPAYAETVDLEPTEDLSECSGSLYHAFMDKFDEATDITIEIELIESRYLSELSTDSMTVIYEDGNVFWSSHYKNDIMNKEYYEYWLDYYGIDLGSNLIFRLGEDGVAYFPFFPYLFLEIEPILRTDDAQSIKYLLELMIFYSHFFENGECYIETIDGTDYHVEKYVVELTDETIEYKYYFIGEEMVRVSKKYLNDPLRNEDFYVKVSYDEVDDSVFEIPSTAVIDITWYYKISKFLGLV